MERKNQNKIIFLHQFLLIFFIFFCIFTDTISFLIFYSLLTYECLSLYFKYFKFLESLKKETIIDSRQQRYILCLKLITRFAIYITSIICFIYIGFFSELVPSLPESEGTSILNYLFFISIHSELILIILCRILLIAIMLDGIHEIIVIRNFLGIELKFSLLSTKISKIIRSWRGLKDNK